MEGNIKNPVKLEEAIQYFINAFKNTKAKIIIIGGLSIIAYGNKERITYDIDAEIHIDDKNSFYKTIEYFEKIGVTAHLSDNIGRWGMIDMPPNYRNRTTLFQKIGDLEFHLLSPLDLVVSKLRSFRDIDIDDLKFLINKFNISAEEIKKSAEEAIKVSPISTDIFNFNKRLDYFISQEVKLRADIDKDIEPDFELK